MLQDLYGDDLGDPQNIEEIVEYEREEALYLENDGNEEGRENEQGEGDASAEAQPTGRVVDPKKKRTVLRPQPKLNPERLMGPRGIATLETVFKDFKFHGNGHEKDDLDQMMKKLEHWAHRLYPRFQFDDCLEKIESLGHKKPVMTYVKKIRMGMVTADDAVVVPNDIEDDVDEQPPIDEFDALISQQLSQIQTDTSIQTNPVSSQPSTTLTEEQRERMLKNRLLAEERRLARMKAEHEKKMALEKVSEIVEATPHSITSGHEIIDATACSQLPDQRKETTEEPSHSVFSEREMQGVEESNQSVETEKGKDFSERLPHSNLPGKGAHSIIHEVQTIDAEACSKLPEHRKKSTEEPSHSVLSESEMEGVEELNQSVETEKGKDFSEGLPHSNLPDCEVQTIDVEACSELPEHRKESTEEQSSFLPEKVMQAGEESAVLMKNESSLLLI